MTSDLILQAVVSGLLLGGVYSLICVGLTLTFGVMRIINFAHGEFLMVAMYGTYFFTQAFHTEPYAAVVVVLPGLFIFGVLVFHLLVRPILDAEPLKQMLRACSGGARCSPGVGSAQDRAVSGTGWTRCSSVFDGTYDPASPRPRRFADRYGWERLSAI
jgi:hypothetical protein